MVRDRTKLQISFMALVIAGGLYYLSLVVEISKDTVSGVPGFSVVLPANVIDFLTDIGVNVVQIIIFSVVASAVGGTYSHKKARPSNTHSRALGPNAKVKKDFPYPWSKKSGSSGPSRPPTYNVNRRISKKK